MHSFLANNFHKRKLNIFSFLLQSFIVFAGLMAVANAGLIAAPVGPIAAAPYIVRAPEHDSAAIESHRLGGNFAYGVVTAEAFAKVTPQLATITHPVAETTYVHEPAPIAHVQPAPIEHTHFAAQPILREEAILAQEPVIGPIGTTTHVHQPLYKTLTYTQTAPVAVATAPIAVEGYAAAPIAVGGYAAAAPIAVGGYAAAGYAAAPIALAH
jgi:hypothetical protein